MRGYTRKKHVTLRFFDGGTNKVDIVGYTDLPEIPDPYIDVPPEAFISQGSFVSTEEGDDNLIFSDFAITIDIVDSQVTTNKHELDAWFNQFKTVGGADLTSTNDGNAQVFNNQTKALQSINLDEGWNTLGMIVFFDNAQAEKGFGKKFNYVLPGSARFSTSGKAQVTINVRILASGESITSLPA